MMDCKKAQDKLAEMSADCCAEATLQELRAHLKECPPCLEEWRHFERTLLVVSTATQPVPSPQQTQAMWSACCERIYAQVERERLTQSAKRSARGGWMSGHSAWSWMALGGALAALGGALLLPTAQPDVAPSTTASTTSSPSVTRFVELPSADATASRIASAQFGTPPDEAALFINHHAAMAFDPFADHVGTTLVSYSASGSASGR